MTPYVGMRSSIHTVHFFVQDNCETRSDTLDTAGWSKSKTTKVEKGLGSTELVVVSTRPSQSALVLCPGAAEVWLSCLASGGPAMVAVPSDSRVSSAVSQADAAVSHDRRTLFRRICRKADTIVEATLTSQLSKIHLNQSLVVRKTKKENDQSLP